MLKIDKAIQDTSNVISKNISHFDASERGLLSQNILAQLRNLVEYIAGKVCANGQNIDIDPNNYDVNVSALKYLKSRGDLKFLYTFHELLQKSVSHYTLDEGGSERLMLKYYEYLLKIKIYLKDNFQLDVLNNIEDFPLNTDPQLHEYHEKIADAIQHPSKGAHKNDYSERYYIQKIKPFFVNQCIYYEVTFTAASNKTSKFDRVIAFTKLDIMGNYAVKLDIHSDDIEILGKKMNVLIIDSWLASIRPCEFDNLSNVLRLYYSISTSSVEYRNLMTYITKSGMNLTDLVTGSDEYYQKVKNQIIENARSVQIFNILDLCRNIILRNSGGRNVLRYLLLKMNNLVIKYQYWNKPCDKLSDLNLSYGCIPFDNIPYNYSLRVHNPRIYDLFDCIPTDGREHELFARLIRNNTENNGIIFTSIEDIKGFNDVKVLIAKYNESLYYKHRPEGELGIFNNHVFINEYTNDCNYIINKLYNLSQNGISQYSNSVDSWLQRTSYYIDSDEKKNALRKMFSSSHVVMIYGSAGTGKSTLINHISNFFADRDKIYLANTYPAINNLRRKVKVGNSEYKTIASFLSKKNNRTDCDVLFIDECSTVSNADMREVLNKSTFKLLVLVGDIYQIESISFGNWFKIASSFMPSNSIFELTKPYRSDNENLLLVWDRVRKLDIAILEPLVKNNYSENLNESIFDFTDEEQIILCLNYDGLYGINNVNRFLQNSNPNPRFNWGINIYKVNDPILFNETDRFSPLIHNNMKGRIVNIKIEEKRIWFEIELDITINELDADEYDFDLIGVSQKGNSIIRFYVNKYKSTDEDDDSLDVVIPFQVAYAISIHKAQGLEFSSVKIIITNEVEERITHNIFYTAITRAKDKLKIYWSPETENKILKEMDHKNNCNKDVALLKLKYPDILKVF